jgi:undecaprenyl diphosphate synthase
LFSFSGLPMNQLSPSTAPAHVAIIMDGNGRWASARGLPRAMGHRKGVEAVREAVRTAAECGVRDHRSDGVAEDLHPA